MNPDVIRLQLLASALKFSLKIVFLFILLAALAAYNYPLTNVAYCDYSYPGNFSTDPCYSCRSKRQNVEMEDPLNCEFIDIHGRNKNQLFKPVLKHVRLLDSEASDNPNFGQLRVTFRSSLRAAAKLQGFEILRAEPSAQ